MTESTKCYLLQIINHSDLGEIRTVKVTGSKTKAEKWFKKRLKTDRYSHGYQVVNL